MIAFKRPNSRLIHDDSFCQLCIKGKSVQMSEELQKGPPEKGHAGVTCTLKGWEGVRGDWAGLSLAIEDNFSSLDSSPGAAAAAGLG